MDEADIVLAYIDWIKDYTNNDFLVYGEEEIPPMIYLIVDEMIKHDANETRLASSESLGDYSVSYENSEIGYSRELLGKLKPYVKVKFV